MQLFFSTASVQAYATGRAAGIAGIKSQIEKTKYEIEHSLGPGMCTDKLV